MLCVVIRDPPMLLERILQDCTLLVVRHGRKKNDEGDHNSAIANNGPGLSEANACRQYQNEKSRNEDAGCLPAFSDKMQCWVQFIFRILCLKEATQGSHDFTRCDPDGMKLVRHRSSGHQRNCEGTEQRTKTNETLQRKTRSLMLQRHARMTKGTHA